MVYAVINLRRSNGGCMIKMYGPDAKLVRSLKVLISKRVYNVLTVVPCPRDDNSSSNRHRAIFVSGKPTNDAWAVQPSLNKALLKKMMVPCMPCILSCWSLRLVRTQCFFVNG